MRMRTALTLCLVLLVAPLPVASAGPSAAGISSDNVEWIKRLPEMTGVLQGGRLVGHYFYTSVDAQGLVILDVADPENPRIVGRLAIPHAAENEDLTTNGEVVLLSQWGDVDYFNAGRATPASRLYVIDVEDKSQPTMLSVLEGGGDHTVECLFDCTWAYTAHGKIIDLRKPANPKLAEARWDEGIKVRERGAGTYGHDVTEVRPGLVLTTTNPMLLLDTSNPIKPRVVARAAPKDPAEPNSTHLVEWPNGGKEPLIFGHDETISAVGRCELRSTAFATWDASHWKKTRTFTPLDEHRMRNGTFTDGHPPSGGPYGCSAHLFDVHPMYGHGGLVAAAFYDHGARLLRIATDGKIKEIGFFLPWAGWTGAVYWITPRIAYVMDYRLGIDILRFTGRF